MIDLAALRPQLFDPTSGGNQDSWFEPSREGSSGVSLLGSENGPNQEPGWAAPSLVPSFIPKSLVNCWYNLLCFHKSKNPRNFWVTRVVGDWEEQRPMRIGIQGEQLNQVLASQFVTAFASFCWALEKWICNHCRFLQHRLLSPVSCQVVRELFNLNKLETHTPSAKVQLISLLFFCCEKRPRLF